MKAKFLNNFRLFTNATLIYTEYSLMTCCEPGTADVGSEEADVSLLLRATRSGRGGDRQMMQKVNKLIVVRDNYESG